jgi:hypothetical protein
MATAAQSAQEILNLFVASGARPGRTFPVMIGADTFSTSRFPGALQGAFLQAGYALSDLAAGLAYAVTQGWLTQGQTYNEGQQNGATQTYLLEQSGWTQGGGTAPTMAQSAQQLLNVWPAPVIANNSIVDAAGIVGNFVGTVGGNTFAPEDLLPGAYYAVAQGWLRPWGQVFSNKWSLTAEGVAQVA